MRERALEIIDAYGADAARWPADERMAVLALARDDEAVRAVLAAAREMDAMLGAWAMDVPAPHFDADALLPAGALPSGGSVRRGMTRWLAGGAVAAALALALVVTPDRPGRQTSVAMTDINSALPGSAGDAVELDEGFAMFFTPTADEEDVI